tara:strand:+ start:4674 stop:5078 length:405 start_codon:yes stop_codon:yes gene_type:complete
MKLVSLEQDVLTQMSRGLTDLGEAVETLMNHVGDNRPLSISSDGKVCVKDNLHVNGKLGIGVNNIPEDVALMANGPIAFDNMKMQSADKIPENGTYNQGDIVWNNQSAGGSHVGWVCIRKGTPGIWKPFGIIEV